MAWSNICAESCGRSVQTALPRGSASSEPECHGPASQPTQSANRPLVLCQSVWWPKPYSFMSEVEHVFHIFTSFAHLCNWWELLVETLSDGFHVKGLAFYSHPSFVFLCFTLLVLKFPHTGQKSLESVCLPHFSFSVEKNLSNCKN